MSDSMESTRGGDESLQGAWFPLASIGLGLCIVATEAKRYTVLWTFGTKTPLEVCLIVAVLGLILVGMIQAARVCPLRIHRNIGLLVCIALFQTAGFVVAYLQMMGMSIPAAVLIASSVVTESAFLLLPLYGIHFASFGIRRAILGFSAAVTLAGAIQLVTALISFEAAFVLIVLSTPLACLLLWLSSRHKERTDAWFESLDDTEKTVFGDSWDVDTQATISHRKPMPFARTKTLVLLYVTVLAMQVILLGIHAQWSATQDGDVASFLIQVCAATGMILAGNLFLLVRNSLAEQVIIEFCRMLILPLGLAALYLAALFQGALVSLSVIPLNIAHPALLLLVWIAPLIYRTQYSPAYLCCVGFLIYKLGWAIGVFGIQILPHTTVSWVGTAFICVAFFVLLVLSLMQFLANRFAAPVVSEALASSSSASDAMPDPFELACARVTEKYHLTPRERDVLALLARGRTAGYIARTLVISDGTARTHIMHIYQKMNIRSQQALMDEVEAAQE